MPTLTLTDRFVGSATPVATRTNYSDRLARGLVFRKTPAGSRTWYFVYRVHGSPSEWITLGTYPAMPLAEARKEAGRYRHMVDVEERNPAAEMRAEKHAPPPTPAPAVFTFADFVPVFVAFQKGRKRTWADDEAKIRKYLLPAWGTLPLREITRQHIHDLLDGLAGKGMTIGVNRIQALVSRIFTLALDRGRVDAHPAARMIKRFEETASTRTLTDDEIRELWAGLDNHPGAAADAIRLRLLLGQRGEETAGMRWAEVDLQAAVWQLPGARTKNKRPHVVALPPTALALLDGRRTTLPADEPAVFPGLTLMSDEHKALGVLHGGYEWKDLRRTVATRLAGLGYDDTTIGRVLNHARVTVTAKHYNQHAYVEEIRRALDAWDRELSAILDPATAKARKVLKHRPRRAGQ